MTVRVGMMKETGEVEGQRVAQTERHRDGETESQRDTETWK